MASTPAGLTLAATLALTLAVTLAATLAVTRATAVPALPGKHPRVAGLAGLWPVSGRLRSPTFSPTFSPTLRPSLSHPTPGLRTPPEMISRSAADPDCDSCLPWLPRTRRRGSGRSLRCLRADVRSVGRGRSGPLISLKLLERFGQVDGRNDKPTIASDAG